MVPVPICPGQTGDSRHLLRTQARFLLTSKLSIGSDFFLSRKIVSFGAPRQPVSYCSRDIYRLTVSSNKRRKGTVSFRIRLGINLVRHQLEFHSCPNRQLRHWRNLKWYSGQLKDKWTNGGDIPVPKAKVSCKRVAPMSFPVSTTAAFWANNPCLCTWQRQDL